MRQEDARKKVNILEARVRAHDLARTMLEAKLAAIQAIVNEQAEDVGLWFVAHYITEEHLQQALRKLHSVIEGES